METVNPSADPAKTSTKFMEEKMEGLDPNLMATMMNGNNNDDKSWWLILLVLLRGGLFGENGKEGAGTGACCPPATLEQLTNTQTALSAQMANINQSDNDHFLSASDTAARNQLANETNAMSLQGSIAAASASNLIGQKDLTSAIAGVGASTLIGQKDLTAAIADCCCQLGISISNLNGNVNAQACETRNTVNVQGLTLQNAIDKCCCETQTAIALQTNTLERTICTDGDKTRALITANKIDELQAQLSDAKAANSNLQQTVTLSKEITAACCDPCHSSHHGHHRGGGGGNGGQQQPLV